MEKSYFLKNNFRYFSDFTDFWDFLAVFSSRYTPPRAFLSPTLKPPIPHGSSIVVFYKKSEKIVENRISDADRHKPISES